MPPPDSDALVTIGMPVFNGQRYLAPAIESVRAQTFSNWRLVIGDNASTDSTPDIAADFARSDPRIRFIRRESNIGAAPNFNDLFHLAETPYFKWAAHDDVLRPRFLEACLERLQQDPGMALCHSLTDHIDAAGRFLGRIDLERPLVSDRPSVRFKSALTTSYPSMVWGVMRRSVAARTPLIASYVNSDRYFLAQILVSGRFGLVDEPLFELRRHDEQFAAKFRKRTAAENQAWFDPRAAIGATAGLRSIAHLSASIVRAPIPLTERAACLFFLARRMTEMASRRFSRPGPDPTPSAPGSTV